MTSEPTARLPRGLRRVAVLRALHLGDMLCAVPALRALRRALPEAEITLVGLPWADELARRFPSYLDDFLALPAFPGLPEAGGDVHAFPRFLERAQRRRFDLVIQLHGAGDVTNPLAVLLGGGRTAGFFRPGAFCPDPALYLAYPEAGHEVRRLLRLTRFLDCPWQDERLEFPLDERDRGELAALADAHDFERGEYVCVHPGSRLSSRRWAPEGFAAVADGLAERGLRVVLTGSGDEQPIARRVEAAMTGAAADLTGQTTLGAVAALLEGARLLVCNDTGISHLAAALGVPSVVVFTVSDPARWAPLDTSRHHAVTPALVGPRAGPAAVLAAAEQLLAETDAPVSADKGRRALVQ